ncbi:MAG: hypothetical protein ACYC6W_07280 [Nitrosotalea sp.]
MQIQLRDMCIAKKNLLDKISRVKKMNNRRALSTVVTSAIMLTAVAVIGSSIVAWSNSNLRTFESSLANVTATNTNKINEKLTIENVNFCKLCYSGAHGVNVTLTNLSSLRIAVSQIQLNTVNIVPTPATNILPGKSFTYNQSYNWQSQTPINVYVTTTRGSIFSSQVVPP